MKFENDILALKMDNGDFLNQCFQAMMMIKYGPNMLLRLIKPQSFNQINFLAHWFNITKMMSL